MTDSEEMTAIQKGKEINIEWKIPKFDSLSEEIDAYYVSSLLFSFEKEFWKLVIYPNDAIHLGIFRVSRYPGAPINVAFSFAFKTVNGKKDLEKQETGIFDGISSNYIYEFLYRADFDRRKSDFLASGSLTVICTLKALDSTGYWTSVKCSYCEKNVFDSGISRHEKECMDRPVTCPDCFAVVPLEQIWLCLHKCHQKLTKECSYCKENVVADTISMHMAFECKDRPIKCPECPEVCRKWHEHERQAAETEAATKTTESFVIHLSEENVFGLFTAADKYYIPTLRTKCINFIKKILSVRTFCETFTLALQHNEVELMHLATNFFIKNAKKILVTVKWQSFAAENPTQSNELFIKFVESVGGPNS